jgi:hypothetical protein
VTDLEFKDGTVSFYLQPDKESAVRKRITTNAIYRMEEKN